MIRHYFAPNRAGLLVLLAIALIECQFHAEQSFAVAGDVAVSIEAYCVPSLYERSADVTIRGKGPARHRIVWTNALPLLTGSYLVAMLLGRLASGPITPIQKLPSSRSRRALFFALAFGCATAATFLTAGVISKLRWGYFYRPNAIDRRVSEARAIHSSGEVFLTYADGVPVAQLDAVGEPIRSHDLSDQLAEKTNTDPRTIPFMPPETFARVEQVLLKKSLAMNATLPQWWLASGEIVQFSGPLGEPLLFAQISSGSECCQLLSTDEREPQLLSENGWRFRTTANDPFLTIQFSDLVRTSSLWVGTPMVVVVLLSMILRRVVEHRRRRTRGFEVVPNALPVTL
jgi:hypothetical protein